MLGRYFVQEPEYPSSSSVALLLERFKKDVSYLYGLYYPDPDTQENILFYLGISKSPARRKYEHLKNCKASDDSDKCKIINKYRKSITMLVLYGERVDVIALLKKTAISSVNDRGIAKLTNVAETSFKYRLHFKNFNILAIKDLLERAQTNSIPVTAGAKPSTFFKTQPDFSGTNFKALLDEFAASKQFLYGLFLNKPDGTQELFYVGVTYFPELRLCQHGSSTSNPTKARLIRKNFDNVVLKVLYAGQRNAIEFMENIIPRFKLITEN